MIKPNTSRQ